jgi:hypothetical protein
MSNVKLSKVKMGWDAAIADAKVTIERLKAAIAVFEENKAEGRSWPRTQSGGHNSRQQHSD